MKAQRLQQARSPTPDAKTTRRGISPPGPRLSRRSRQSTRCPGELRTPFFARDVQKATPDELQRRPSSSRARRGSVRSTAHNFNFEDARDALSDTIGLGTGYSEFLQIFVSFAQPPPSPGPWARLRFYDALPEDSRVSCLVRLTSAVDIVEAAPSVDSLFVKYCSVSINYRILLT